MAALAPIARICILAAAVLAPLTGIAQAPRADNPIRLIVPFPPGTALDAIARKISTDLAESTKRSVFVENRPGAGGNVGIEQLLALPHDGSTLLVSVNSPMTVNPLLYRKLKFNAAQEMVAVAGLATGGYILVGRKDLPFDSARKLVAAAAASPDRINYGSHGVGSMPHICMELFQAMASVHMRHVPNKNGASADLLGGHVDVAFEPVALVAPHIQKKSLIGFGASYAKVPSLPDMPLLGEQLPGYHCSTDIGVFASRQVPAAVRQKLSQDLVAIASSKSFQDTALALNLTVNPRPMDAYAAELRKEEAQWQKILPPLNIQLD